MYTQEDSVGLHPGAFVHQVEDVQVGDILALAKYGVNGSTPTWKSLPVTAAGSSIIASDGTLTLEIVRVSVTQGECATMLRKEPDAPVLYVTAIAVKYDGSLS